MGRRRFLSRGSSAATAGRLVAGAFTVEKRSRAREKNSSRIPRIDEISEVPRFFGFTGDEAKRGPAQGRPLASARAWPARLRCSRGRPRSRPGWRCGPATHRPPAQGRERRAAIAPRRSTDRGFCESAWCGGSRRASRGGGAGVVVQRTSTRPQAAAPIQRVTHVSHGACGGTAPAESRRAR